MMIQLSPRKVEIYVVEVQYRDFSDSHVAGCIGYTSTWQDAKMLAKDHYVNDLEWLSGYESLQAQTPNAFYAIYAENLNTLTEFGNNTENLNKRLSR